MRIAALTLACVLAFVVPAVPQVTGLPTGSGLHVARWQSLYVMFEINPDAGVTLDSVRARVLSKVQPHGITMRTITVDDQDTRVIVSNPTQGILSIGVDRKGNAFIVNSDFSRRVTYQRPVGDSLIATTAWGTVWNQTRFGQVGVFGDAAKLIHEQVDLSMTEFINEYLASNRSS